MAFTTPVIRTGEIEEPSPIQIPEETPEEAPVEAPAEEPVEVPA